MIHLNLSKIKVDSKFYITCISCTLLMIHLQETKKLLHKSKQINEQYTHGISYFGILRL